jgi:hypothetical protein
MADTRGVALPTTAKGPTSGTASAGPSVAETASEIDWHMAAIGYGGRRG